MSSSSSVVSKEDSSNSSTNENKSENGEKYIDQKKTSTKETISKRREGRFSCIHNCFWFIGIVYSIWCLLFFLYNAKLTGPSSDLSPGVKLHREGLVAKHPVVLVPGMVTGGLELWEGHNCAEGLFRERLWGGTFGGVYKRPLCWVQHMSLNNETGLDPDGIRVRPVPGLVAADYFAPGYFVWAVLIENLARIGYEDKNMYMAAYDWRISFQNTEVRDQTLSRVKSNIELMVATNGGKKAVVIPHSMGALYFLHFMKWVEAPAPMGGGGGSDWCAKHIKAVMNIGGPFLGVPKAVSGLFSSEAKDVAVARAIAPGVLAKDLLRLPLQHLMRMTRTWDSTMSMIPKGGNTIWGGLDWSPEEGYNCNLKERKRNSSQVVDQNGTVAEVCTAKMAHYGRMISFGKDVAEANPSEIERTDFRDALKGHNLANSTCDDLWTEYHDMGFAGIKAVADYKVYTAGSVIDLLRFVAPKMMKRGDAHFSHGIAENLDDPLYDHYKYWSNPLETKLPNAPDMEIFSMYGVGLPTERSYIYKLTPTSDQCYIPFEVDTSADSGKEEASCLKGGVYTTDGDETVPVVSAGYMCAKGWRGTTRFNPSGIRTYNREYDHAPPNLLEGRGLKSGAHVDIMGNFALIEDVIRVAAGATGEELGGDQVHSDIFKWSEKINLKL